MNISKIIVRTGLLALLAGCSSPYGWDKAAGQNVDKALADAKKASADKSAVPSDVNQALLPALQIPLPEGGLSQLEPRFDFSVSNAPARQVFLGLVEGTQYSLMVHPEVGGAVSLNLKDVTVLEALDSIRRLYGYDYKREGNRFFVLPRGMQTRLFPVNYLNLSRRGKSDTRVVSGELTRGRNASTSGANPSGAAAYPAGGAAASNSAGIQVETESKADFWKELEATVKAIIGTEGGRAAVANPQSGLIVVRAMPDELRVVEDFLGQTQNSVNRQVVLEAKIIEVELKDRFQTGINWADLGRTGSTSITTGQVGGGTIFGGASVSEIAGNAGNLNPGAFSAISGTNASAFGGVFSLAIRATSFSAFVELLQTQGNVQVLSSPRVSTVNNQKAVIKVGGDEFFVTGVTNTPTTVGTSTVYTPTVELTPFFSGIALDVTPQIDDVRNIVLHIHPAVSQVIEQNKSIRISNEDYNLPSALSSIQESDNIVRASSGQIIIIGGLMKEGSTDENASVPLLGDIPIIGNLFKHKRVTRIKKELVILLKATVVDSAQVWGDMVDQSQGRIENIRRER